MIAGTLEVQWASNIARLAQDMAQAKQVVSSAMSDISRTVGQAKSLLATLGVGISGAMFVGLIKGSIDALDHLRDLSKSTDISVEKLAGLRLVARQTGSDLDGMAAAINKLSQNIGKDAEKFARLGITAKEPLEAFKQLSDIFTRIRDPQQRAAVAAEALGKSWASTAPALAEGGKRLGEMIERGTRLSGVTKDLTDQADELNDKLAELGGTGGLLTRAIGPLLPMLNDIADNMLEAQDNTNKLTDSFSPLAEAFRAVIVFGANVSFVIKGIGTEIGGILAQLDALSRAGSAMGPLGWVGGIMGGNRESIGEALREFKEIRRMMLEDAEQARRDFDAYEQRLMNLGKPRAAADIEDAGFRTTVPAGRGRDPDAERRAADFLNAEKNRANAASAAQKEASAYEQVRKAISEKTAAMQAELAGQEKLSDAEQLALKIMVDLRDGALNLSKAHRIQLGIDLERLLLTDKDLKNKAALAAAAKAELERIDKLIEAQEQYNAAYAELRATHNQNEQDHKQQLSLIALETKALMELGPQYGELTKRTLEYHIQRETSIALTRVDIEEKRELLKIDMDLVENWARAAEVMAQFDAERAAVRARVREGLTAQASLNEARTSAESQLNIWNDMWREVDNVAREAFVNIHNKGDDVFKRLRDSLKNTLWDLLYQMTIKRWIINIAANVTGTGGGGAAGGGTAGAVSQGINSIFGGGGGVGTGGISNLFNTGSILAGTQFASGFATTAFANQATTAALIESGTVGWAGAGMEAGAGLGSLGTSMSGAFNAIAPYAGAILSLAQGDYKGAAIQAGAIALGTAIMPGIGTAIGAVVGALLSMFTSSNKKPRLSLGGFNLTKDVQGNIISASSTAGGADSTSARAFVDTMYERFSRLSKELGATWNQVEFAFAADTGHNSNFPNFGASAMVDGRMVHSVGEGVGRLRTLNEETVQLEAARALVAAFQGSSLPPMLRKYFDSLTPLTMTIQEVETAINFAASIKQLTAVMGSQLQVLMDNTEALANDGEKMEQTVTRVVGEFQLVEKMIDLFGANVADAFDGVGVAALQMRSNLISLLGGLESASALTRDYYQNFYTETERHFTDLRIVNQLIANLGISAIPKTRAEFRALVDAQDLSTEAGLKMYASLIALSGAFAAVTDEITEADNAINSLAGQLAAVTGQLNDAISEQISLSEQAASAAHDAAQRYRQIATDLRNAVIQLRGGELSPLLPGQKLAEQRGNLETMFTAAMGGDQTALSGLPTAAQSFLEASREFNASSQAYTNDFLRVMQILSQAQTGATGMAGQQDYIAALMDIQTGALKAIQEELAKPTPDSAEIARQTAVLNAVRVLMNEQNAAIYVGNSTQDAIRNIQRVNNTISEVTLTALLEESTNQGTISSRMLQGLNNIANLLAQQLTLQQALLAAQNAVVPPVTPVPPVVTTPPPVVTIPPPGTTTTLPPVVTPPVPTGPGYESPTDYLAAHGYPGYMIVARDDGSLQIRQSSGGLVGDETEDAIKAMLRSAGYPGFRSGLSYVPHDNFLANLHEGERVLTREENRRFGSGSGESWREMCAEIRQLREEAVAAISYAADSEKREIQQQTKELKNATKDAARERAHFLESAREARTFA